MNWIKELEFNKYGRIKNTINNVYLILTNDPGFDVYYDYCEEMTLVKSVPWRNNRGSKYGMGWTDMEPARLDMNQQVKSLPFLSDTTQLYLYLEKNYGITEHDKIDAGFRVYLARKDGDHD